MRHDSLTEEVQKSQLEAGSGVATLSHQSEDLSAIGNHDPRSFVGPERSDVDKVSILWLPRADTLQGPHIPKGQAAGLMAGAYPLILCIRQDLGGLRSKGRGRGALELRFGLARALLDRPDPD
eukprot:scaffold334_cov241-Pinguiococcus_pyrenoidosus.AAC.7